MRFATFGGSASAMAMSFRYAPFPRHTPSTVFCALKMLRISLFGLAKRRKQPERYMTCALRLVKKQMGNI
jgi:hypothetical protein